MSLAKSSLYVLVLLPMTMWAQGALAQHDTLVVKGEGDQFNPAAASSWVVEGDTIKFSLAEGVDASAVADMLSDRLAMAEVSLQEGKLVISGIPAPALLDQLSTLSLSGEADPLAELAGLGGGVLPGDAPEGGGSIRASKPMAQGPTRKIEPHEASERFEAEVLAIDHKDFPAVSVTLKMRRPARRGKLRRKLYWGKEVEAPVIYNTVGGGIDFADSVNRLNLGAWYLQPGDQVMVHFVGKKPGELEIDWVSRK